MACAVIGFLSFSYNLKFDSHLKSTENLYRVYSTYEVNGEKIVSSEIPMEGYDYLKTSGSVEAVFRYFNLPTQLKNQEGTFEEDIFFRITTLGMFYLMTL